MSRTRQLARPPAWVSELLVETAPKKARILAAALDLFVDRGFHGTTIPSIARQAGVATGTIYVYFESKEQLVNALLGGLRRALARQLQEAITEAGDGVRAQFESIWEVFSQFAVCHERALAFCDLHHHASYLSAEADASWKPGERVLNAHFRAGCRAGIYADLPVAVLRSVFAGILLGAHKFSRAGKFKLTPKLLLRLRESAWRAVTRPPASAKRQKPEQP